MSVLFPDSFHPSGICVVPSDIIITAADPRRAFLLVGLPASAHEDFMGELRKNGYRPRIHGSLGSLADWSIQGGDHAAGRGRLVSQGTITLDKNIRGHCHLEAAASVTVGAGSHWTGNIQGTDVELESRSKLDGNIATPGTVVLRSGARVMGDVMAGHLEIEDGAAIVGRIHTNKAEATRQH